jgi:hypothetical protein
VLFGEHPYQLGGKEPGDLAHVANNSMRCGFQTPCLEFVAFTPVLLAVAGEACRPRSVIVSQVTLIGRPPACTVPGVAVAIPSNTNRPKVSTVKPCANKTD